MIERGANVSRSFTFFKKGFGYPKSPSNHTQGAIEPNVSTKPLYETLVLIIEGLDIALQGCSE